MKKKPATPLVAKSVAPAPKKHVEITAQALDFIVDQSPVVLLEFRRIIRELSMSGRLSRPDGEKVEGYDNLFEMRVHASDGQFRAFYCYAVGDKVYVLSGFVKKTQKTPVAEIRKALRIKKELGL